MVHWAPLESNPEVLNDFIKSLGVNNSVGFHDVYGLDEDLLCMSKEKRLEIANKNKYNLEDQSKISPYFLKQSVSNACGAIAVIHSLSNNLDSISLDDGSIFDKFLKSTKDLSFVEKGKALESASEFASANVVTSTQGQTAPMDAEADVDHHFVSFVLNNGYLVELDGNLQHPIIHDKSENLLSSAATVIKSYMATNPDEPNYSIVALAGPDY